MGAGRDSADEPLLPAGVEAVTWPPSAAEEERRGSERGEESGVKLVCCRSH